MDDQTPVTQGPGNEFDQWAEVARRAVAIPQGHALYDKAQQGLALARTHMKSLIEQHRNEAAQYGADEQDKALAQDVTPGQTAIGNVIDQLTLGAGRTMSGVGRMLSTATAGPLDPETHRPIAQYQSG